VTNGFLSLDQNILIKVLATLMDQIRRIIIFFLFNFGILRIWIFFNRKKIPILMFHGVMDDDGKQPYIPLRSCLKPKTLDQYLKLITKYYNIISLDEAIHILSKKISPKPYSIVLTFDDGYRNNLTHAEPVLTQYKASMTIYLITTLMSKNIPLWVDRLDYALLKATKNEYHIRIAGEELIFNGETREERGRSYQLLRRKAKDIECDDLEFSRAMSELAEEVEKDSGKKLTDIWEKDDWTALLKWSEVTNSLDKKITYGSHTCDHYLLAKVSLEVAKDQLTRSKIEIEKNLGINCDHFAYPNGSFNGEVAKLAKEAGYTSAVTTIEGINEIGCDLHQLRRVGIPDSTDLADLLFRVSGLSQNISEIAQRFKRSK
jgi:peptidoglycan/xylan/chitin deacetylase (PgdA/CDA1 family)